EAAAAKEDVELILILPPDAPGPQHFDEVVVKTTAEGAVRLKDVGRVERGPRHVGYPRRGDIDFADNRVDADSGTWRLRATFRNPDQSLYPGLYVRVRLPVGTPYKATLVAPQALATDQGQKFLFVLKTGTDKEGKTVHTVDYRRVVVGRVHDGM